MMSAICRTEYLVRLRDILPGDRYINWECNPAVLVWESGGKYWTSLLENIEAISSDEDADDILDNLATLAIIGWRKIKTIPGFSSIQRKGEWRIQPDYQEDYYLNLVEDIMICITDIQDKIINGDFDISIVSKNSIAFV